jgi:type IV conjugative transfer system coupling protein TraD
MILEVIGKLAIPAFLWAVVCLCTANARSSQREQTYGIQALQAWAFNRIGWPFPTKLTIRDLHGAERVYLNGEVPHLAWLQPYAQAYYHNLWLGLLLWLCGAAVIACVATAWFIDSGEEKLKARFIRGQASAPLPRLVEEIEAFNTAEVKRRGIVRFRPVRLLGVPYPLGTEQEHTLTVGSPGSGKSQALHDLLESIRARGDRAVVYDPELEYTKHHFVEGTDRILNPYDARSVAWSPYNDARDLPDFEKLAACIFKEPKSGDPYWTRATRAVFVYAAYRLRRLYPHATLDDLLRVFFGPMSVLTKLLQNTPAAQHLAGGSNGRTQSIQSVLAEGVGSLVHLAGNAADFSLRAWVNDPSGRPGFLFLSAPETHMTSLRPLLSFWSELVVSALLSRIDDGERRTTWIVLDEFPSLGKVESLASGPERLRKYGGAVVLGMQQVSQIQEIYGHEVAQTIIGQCATKLILRCQDPETAKHMAEQLGRRQTRRVDETVSYGANSLRDGVGLTPREDLELVALPDQVMNLPKFHGFIRVSNARDGEPFPIATIRFGYTPRPRQASGLVALDGPDPVDAFFAQLASPFASTDGAEDAEADPGQTADGAAAAGARELRNSDTTGQPAETASAEDGPARAAAGNEDAVEIDLEARRRLEAGVARPSAYVELVNKQRRDETADIPLAGVATWRKRSLAPGEVGTDGPAQALEGAPDLDAERSLSFDPFDPDN